MLKVVSDLIGDWMNFEQTWLRILLAVVIAVVGHVIAVMRLMSVFLRAKLTLHSLDGRFLRATLNLYWYCLRKFSSSIAFFRPTSQMSAQQSMQYQDAFHSPRRQRSLRRWGGGISRVCQKVP